jgi:alpha-2-macroglobulin
MAVAWSKDKVGRASGDVTVRDPVVLTATLPRFMLASDRSAMQLEIDNVEGPAGDYRISVQSDGPVRLAAGAPQTMRLRARQRDRLSVPLTASAAGIADIKVTSQAPETSRSTATTCWRRGRRTASSPVAPFAPLRPAKA